MKPALIYPSVTPTNGGNISSTFSVLEGQVVETIALGLPATAYVTYERGFALDDCGGVRWVEHSDPCCFAIYQTTNGVVFTIPGQYRAIVVSDPPLPISALSDVEIFVNTYNDPEGNLALRHNCCAPKTLCMQIADLGPANRIGG